MTLQEYAKHHFFAYVVLPWNYFDPTKGTIGVREFSVLLVKELGMGNILFLCFSHLYVFCINQRLRDKQPQALLEPQCIQALSLLRVCAQLPMQFLSLCHPEHSSTQPSLTPGLRLSPSGRRWFLHCMWLQNLCWFSCRWSSWLSGGALDLLQDTGHTRKEWGTWWLNKYSSQSR